MREKITEWRPLPSWAPGAKIRATYGFTYLKGNRAPYFSITADIKEPGQSRDNWSGGCCHDSIVEAFPELAPLVQWHLTDQLGEPMHYIANAKYWWNERGKPQKNDYGPNPLRGFKRCAVFGALTSDKLIHVEAVGVVLWLKNRKPALAAAMLETMREFEVELIPGEWPREN